jgi:allophanate hydrolase subunit 2
MPKSIISEPTMPGGVQIPPDEQPIILMVEQTVGGYTKIVTVISVDLPKVAQATPGDTIRFEKVSLETAHLLYQEQQKKLQDLAARLPRS